MLDVEAALEEVQAKSEADIERETAWKWASRAIACKQLFDQTSDIRWYLSASHYRHEAVEHASLADTGATFTAVLVATQGIA